MYICCFHVGESQLCLMLSALNDKVDDPAVPPTLFPHCVSLSLPPVTSLLSRPLSPFSLRVYLISLLFDITSHITTLGRSIIARVLKGRSS
jgi:hypothetical protein